MTRRIVFLSTSIARGGAERQVVDLAIALRQRGWSVAVVSMIPPTDHETELSDAGVELKSLGMVQGRPTPAALIRYARFIRQWRPAVVHAHMVHANLLARIGRLLVPSVPVISTVHNVVEGRRWRELAYRLTDRLSTATTAVSQAATDRYQHVGAVRKGHIVTVPNGVDLSKSTPSPSVRERVRRALGMEGSFVWINVARLVPAKGHDLLLHAFVEVANAHATARLFVAGAGQEMDALSALATHLGLGDKVVLLGERRDVPDLLAAADAFVLSSRWEGMPMVLLEAAAQRLPVVSTDVGGCHEVVPPDAGAILTQPEAPEIAQAMLTIMGMDDGQRATIGSRLREHVESAFDLAHIVTRWEQMYESVIVRR